MAKQSLMSNQPLVSRKKVLAAWFLVVAAAVVVIASALAVINSTFQVRKLTAEHQQLQRDSHKLRVEWGQLLLERSTWGSFNRVERLAVSQLKMQTPESKQVVMVSP